MSPPRGAAAALRIQLEIQGGLKFAELALDVLRFYLKGEADTVALLYELVFNHTLEVVFRDPGGAANPPPVEPPAARLLSSRSASSARTACSPIRPSRSSVIACSSEFFAFPYKFHFVDLKGPASGPAGPATRINWRSSCSSTGAGPSSSRTSRPRRSGWAARPRSTCSQQTAEPIAMTKTRNEYRVVPDVAYPDGMEVYSVDQVTSVDPDRGGDHRVPAVLLAPSRHDARSAPRISGTPCAGRRRGRTTGGPRSISTW